MLVRSGLSPTQAARQVGLGRSTLYRELAHLPNTAPQPAERTILQKLPRDPFLFRQPGLDAPRGY